MRRPNLSLRLQRSLMEEARKAAASEGVSLNQLINVAVAEKLAALRTGEYLKERIRRADRAETLRILDRAEIRNPPMEGDELLIGGLQVEPAPVMGGLHASLEAFSVKVEPAPVMGGLKGFGKKPQPEVQPAPPPDLERAGEISKPAGRATPQLGKLKKRLEKAKGR
jgi:hypothetical protein